MAVSELSFANYGKDEEPATGNTMQLCLHFGDGTEDIVRKAVEVLKDGAEILYPLSPTEHSPLLTDFIDKYGMRWCIFV